MKIANGTKNKKETKLENYSHPFGYCVVCYAFALAALQFGYVIRETVTIHESIYIYTYISNGKYKGSHVTCLMNGDENEFELYFCFFQFFTILAQHGLTCVLHTGWKFR